jgi:transcriptional pleiotropic regulator of transition state genes
MKATGIVRQLDQMGRLVIPAELRHQMGFAVDDPVEMFVIDDALVLQKHQDKCTFCGSTENLKTFMDKHVCKNCVGEIIQK